MTMVHAVGCCDDNLVLHSSFRFVYNCVNDGMCSPDSKVV